MASGSNECAGQNRGKSSVQGLGMTKSLRMLIFAALAFLACEPQPGLTQTMNKVTIGYASMSTVATTLWVTREMGFFTKYGIDARTIFIPGSPTLIATMNTGDVHLGYTGGTA